MNIVHKSEVDFYFRPISRINVIIWYIYSLKWFYLIRFLFRFCLNCEFPNSIKDKKTRLPHPYGIILSSKVVIGNNVTIFHNVTVGAISTGKKHGSPIIEDNVIIYPNSVIIGNLTVGENAIIGAGSVVIKNVERNTIVAGNPAKVIGIIIEDIS